MEQCTVSTVMMARGTVTGHGSVVGLNRALKCAKCGHGILVARLFSFFLYTVFADLTLCVPFPTKF